LSQREDERKGDSEVAVGVGVVLVGRTLVGLHQELADGVGLAALGVGGDQLVRFFGRLGPGLGLPGV
jgi:hypothetical protein